MIKKFIKKIVNMITGHVSLEDVQNPISFGEIERLVKTQCFCEDVEFFNEDDQYYTMSQSDLEMLAERCPSSKFKYVSESRDCDDFARIFRGWLSEHNLGNILCAVVHIRLETGQKHAMMLAITNESKVWFIEPQKGDLLKPYGRVYEVFV